MKTTFAVAIAANLLAIAYAAPGNGAKKAESSGDVSVFENEKGNTSIQISKTSDDGDVDAEAYCGGFSYAGCSSYCYYSGYACYYCSASWCNCDNYSC